VVSVLEQYQQSSRRRYQRAAQAQRRLDIQGLRMVSVLAVFACHLWGWPRGGFVGVDVFFVISGFLITGNLLRMAETTGTVSFATFYWNRIRRIVPAATVVLILIYAASTLVFLPFRLHQVGVDALFAFGFASNWWFAYQNTDYFRASDDTVSPVQHYWSLSIEEQFYFVWPALIFVIGVLIVRKRWPHARRMAIAGALMSVISAASLWYAVRETGIDRAWAYFDTFARVWELGVGAVLATAIGAIARIPQSLRPLMSWGGIVLIVAALSLIGEGSAWFPAPWALLPVAGAALVIAAGVGGEPRYQNFLRNPVSTYVGDISYSLYLVHWPVIIIVGALMDAGVYFSITVLGLTFGLAVLSYHFVENPFRKASWTTLREQVSHIRHRRPDRLGSSSHAAAAVAAALLVVAGIAFTIRPVTSEETAPPSPDLAYASDAGTPDVKFGPLGTALRAEITTALSATEWPPLDPSWESLFANGLTADKFLSPEIAKCPWVAVAPPECTYGSSSAPTKVVIVGDSVGSQYAEILRQLAVNSNGRLQTINETMASCVFTQDLIYREGASPECEGRKNSAVDLINTIKPDAVIISNAYADERVQGSSRDMTMAEWSDSLQRMMDRFRGSTKKVVLLSSPPSNAPIRDCTSKRNSKPADCVGTIPDPWKMKAETERRLAASTGAVWIDSRPWFCNSKGRCPSFVGTTPARFDRAHMATPYASKVLPIVAETLRGAGVPIPSSG
jgi:peptidoglycan/LPS O-acetylase OafA/YrhL